MPGMSKTMTVLAALYCAGGLVFAQEADSTTSPEPAKEPLVAQLDRIEQARQTVAAIEERVNEARTETERAKLGMELGAAEVQLARLEAEFQSIATGVDVEDFSEMEPEEFDLAKEAQELLKPIFDELKQVTEKPREIEALRNDIIQLTKQRDLAKEALDKLSKVIEATDDQRLLGELERARGLWEEYARNADNTLSVRNSQLEKGLAEKGSIFDTATDGFTTFFRSRGKNLLATFLTFVVAFLLLRWLGGHLHRFSPWHKPGKRSFYSRLVDVIYKVFCVVGAGMAALLVLYATGDWVLIGLTIIFLFGLALAAKGALPKFYEQARLLLNLGEVREGERVVLDGVPWKVKSLGVFTEMSNPMLEGGELRIPIRNLTEMRSRPFDEKEPWFPCRCNEWVLLADGTRGKVIQQTPETVHMVLLGGSRKAYPTNDFIAATPEVLSRNFRVRSVFGVDYRHQAIATTEIPDAIREVVTRELSEILDRDHIGRIKVEFREAGSSSLDYEIIADMKGEVADKFEVISRAVQRAAVEACNENGWVIPFPQLTLHRAELESEEVSDGS